MTADIRLASLASALLIALLANAAHAQLALPQDSPFPLPPDPYGPPVACPHCGAGMTLGQSPVCRPGCPGPNWSRPAAELQETERHFYRVLGYATQPLPTGGRRVTAVRPQSFAQRLGLEPGDVILAMHGVRVRTQEDMARGFQRGNGYGTMDVLDCRGRGVYRVEYGPQGRR
jgi:hypothetical protein